MFRCEGEVLGRVGRQRGKLSQPAHADVQASVHGCARALGREMADVGGRVAPMDDGFESAGDLERSGGGELAPLRVVARRPNLHVPFRQPGVVAVRPPSCEGKVRAVGSDYASHFAEGHVEVEVLPKLVHGKE